ncbi:MAG TPA: PAS domain S-box protein [Rhizomicrobium sp.]
MRVGIARLTPNEYLFGALAVLTLALGAALNWEMTRAAIGGARSFSVPVQVLSVLELASLIALLLCGGWSWRKGKGELSVFQNERQQFIVTQTASFDSARDPILVFMRSGYITLVNTATEKLFGHPREYLQGRDASEIFEIGPNSADLPERFRMTAEESRVSAVREVWGRRADGSRFPIEITLRDTPGNAGATIGAYARDVSERRAAQEAVRESERQFRLLVNGVTDHAMFMVDRDGIVTNWNAGAERLTGYSAPEAIGRACAFLYTDEDQATDLPSLALRHAIEDGRFEAQSWRVRKDGSRFWADVVIDAVYDDDKNLIGLATIMRDITERKRIEQLKEEFVSTVNHELRTPLTSIAGSLGLLAGGAGGEMPAGAARLINIAHANCQRLIRLINDMLDVEKIQSGKMRFEMTRLSFTDVARRTLDTLQGLGEQAKVAIELTTSGQTDIRGDNDRLVQVITNLVSNAVKFSPPDGTVRVTVSQIDRLVRLCVSDDGPGIPDEFRTRIFSKFSQADSSDSRQKGGTGLGLVIAKEIVDRHGGRLWFESESGKGTRFYVDLPAIGPAAKMPVGARSPATVLICEDDADAASILSSILEREGQTVEIANSIAEAQAVLAAPNQFRVMLLDLVLPDGDGLVLLRQLREQDATRDLPVIVVSAQAQRGREDSTAIALNVVDWMDKPIDIQRLQQAVRAAVRGVETRKPVILHVEDDRDVLQVTASVLDACGEIVPVESLASARAFLTVRTPDLVILDIGLGDGSGLELLPDLSACSSTLIPVVIFSAQDDRELLLPQVKAVMTKSKTSFDQLAQTVRRLLDSPEDQPERKIAV